MTDFKKIKKEFVKLPPETRKIIEKNLHKADKFLDNPLIAGIINNVSGYSVEDLKKNLHKMTEDEKDGLFAVIPGKTIKQKTNETAENNQEQLKQSEKIYEETDTHNKPFQNNVPPPPIPPKHTSGKVEGIIGLREIILLIGIAGMIGWLLYQSY